MEALLKHFRDRPQRESFYQYFRELESVYEILSPDAFLRPFVEDYRTLATMYRIVRANYDAGPPLDRDLLRKTAALVREHTETTRLELPEETHVLDVETLERMAGLDQPDTVKVFNLSRGLVQLVKTKAQEAPYLISIGERAEAIARMFEDRQLSAQEALRQLQALLADVRQAEHAFRERGLSPEGFAIAWVLEHQGVTDADAIARRAEEAFQQYPHWRWSPDQERRVKIALYKALLDAGMEKAVDMAGPLLELLRGSSG